MWYLMLLPAGLAAGCASGEPTGMKGAPPVQPSSIDVKREELKGIKGLPPGAEKKLAK
jgi:hypothetical protein